MKKYKENPWWWYVILLCLAFIAGKPFIYILQVRILLIFIIHRFGCCLQGTDHPSLVVIYHRSTLWHIYHCKLYFVETKESVYIYDGYVQPFSTIFYARMGSGIQTIQLMKMLAGVINPGRPVANLYVSCKTCLRFLAEFDDHEKVFHVES